MKNREILDKERLLKFTENINIVSFQSFAIHIFVKSPY